MSNQTTQCTWNHQYTAYGLGQCTWNYQYTVYGLGQCTWNYQYTAYGLGQCTWNYQIQIQIQITLFVHKLYITITWVYTK